MTGVGENDSSLATQCLALCQALASQGMEFNFSLTIFFYFIVNDNKSATMPDYVTRNVSYVILDWILICQLFRPLRAHMEPWLVTTATLLTTTGAVILSMVGSGILSWFSIQLISSNLAS